jgi:hypothetical protein
MVVKRKNAFIKKVKDISISGTIGLALLGGMAPMTGCDSEPAQYETVHTTGIATYISEMEDGEFKITDEKLVSPENSKAYVTYLDGRVETLSMEEVKNLVAKDTLNNTHNWTSGNETEPSSDTHANQNHYHRSGLGTILWYSALGSMMGRTMAPQPGFYANPTTYQKSQQVSQSYRTSTVQKPVGGRKGFFNRTSGTSTRSFGG